MRAPKEAGAGKAKVTFSFAAWKEGRVTPASFEVQADGAFQEKAKTDQAKKDDDVKLVQGKWRVIRAQENGASFMESKIEKMSVLIKKDEIRVMVEGTKSEQGAKFTLDPSTNPKQIDFIKETRDSEWTDKRHPKLFQSWKLDKGMRIQAEDKVQGIYKLEGDTLTLCCPRSKSRLAPKKGSPRPEGAVP